MITKPMLAGTVKDMQTIQYPVLCTPKLDGIRCLKIDGKAVSRNFKQIPNEYVRSWIEANLPDGVDGELIVEGDTFQATTSAVMRVSGEPNVVYYIFDYVMGKMLTVPYSGRMVNLREWVRQNKLTVPHSKIKLVLPTEISNEKELLEYEKEHLERGYEGVMLRTPDSPYKCGRSTVREGYLLKLKRFEDAEAWITGFEERMHNANEAKKDAFGRTERSSHKANLIPTGMLGALVVDKGDGVVFKIGTGFTEEQRKEIWKNRHKYMSKLVKYKSQPTGVLVAPRFPVFLGLRHENDL